ncbi:hypothetical protein BDN67DRAFT_984850 [Paxillus ammoniavirescens]|nr:hypothetical protein BDN67DRAFT_984850 [Paxillus ammoniavirescens]
MSAIIALQTLLDQSASIIEGALRDLERESKADRATAETWTHVNNLIYEEMNAPTVRLPPILIAAHLNIQTVTEIRETQQWPPLLELCGMTDGVYAHPWCGLLPLQEEEDKVLAECRPKGLSEVDQAWTIGIKTAVSSTPPSQEILVGRAASRGWSIQTTPRNMVMPLLSRSFTRSSIPPARQSMQPDDGLSPLPVSKDKEIATLQAQGPHHQHPLPPYPFDLALYIGDTDSPSSPAPRDSMTIADGLIPRSSASATQIPSGEVASARVHPPSPESPRLSAPPIAVLSPATTPSSGPDIVMTPEVDTRQPSPAAVAAAQPNINMPVDAGPAPSALGPMEDVQVSPNITIINVDAVIDVDAAPILMADGTVTAAEAEGDPDLLTAPALPSPQQPAAAFQALTATYGDKEDMEVDD